MPYPLALLPVTDKDLARLDPREALRFQNTFMKNTLIRGLNNVYQRAATIHERTHKSYPSFIEYTETVCEMLRLHVEGDEMFFTKTFPNKTSLDDLLGFVWTKNLQRKKLREMIREWAGELKGWKKEPKSYQGKNLRRRLEELEIPLLEGSFKLVHCIKQDAISKKFDKAQMESMVKENIEWLVTNSDITILVPYCIAHHDIATSKYWPAMTEDGLAAMPELVKQHERQWTFAPFDPVKRTARV